jgi:hypothetical protein
MVVAAGSVVPWWENCLAARMTLLDPMACCHHLALARPVASAPPSVIFQQEDEQ